MISSDMIRHEARDFCRWQGPCLVEDPDAQVLVKAHVLSPAQAIWFPDRMSIIALGNPAAWDGDLTEFGPVNEIDITIPEPSLALSIPDATPESLAKGQAAMRDVLAKSGGAKLTSMKR